AYENGTPGAEMRLRSYSYGAGPPTGISATQILLFIVLPIAVVVLVAVLLWRRRKARIQGQASSPAPSATEGQELGGNNRARGARRPAEGLRRGPRGDRPDGKDPGRRNRLGGPQRCGKDEVPSPPPHPLHTHGRTGNV